MIENELGSKQEFENKLKEIVVNRDNNWFACIVDIDNLGDFIRNNNDRKIAKKIRKVSNK